MTHSVLLCTSFRAHRINNCCAHHPRSCVLGRHCVWWCDFIFQNYGWAPTMGRWRLRGFQQGGEKRPRNTRYQLHHTDRIGSIRILSSFFFFFLKRSHLQNLSPLVPEWVSRSQISSIKMLRFKSCFFAFVLGSADGEMRYAALFWALNFNLGWLFQPYLNLVVQLQSTERTGSLG